MKTYFAAGLVVLLMSGCTPRYDAASGLAESKLAAAADRELGLAIWGTCVAPSRGSLIRRFGGNQELADSYTKFCNGAAAQSDVLGKVPETSTDAQ